MTALDRLSLEIGHGVTGLVGANGAGKSTLIKILLGLLGETSGRSSVLGFDIRTDGLSIRERVGYMPEDDCLPGDVSATEFVAGGASRAVRSQPARCLRNRPGQVEDPPHRPVRDQLPARPGPGRGHGHRRGTGSISEPVFPYARYAMVIQAVLAIFVAAQAPQAASLDLRFRRGHLVCG